MTGRRVVDDFFSFPRPLDNNYRSALPRGKKPWEVGRKEKDRDQTGNFRVNTRDIVPGTRATLEVATRKSSDFYGGRRKEKVVTLSPTIFLTWITFHVCNSSNSNWNLKKNYIIIVLTCVLMKIVGIAKLFPVFYNHCKKHRETMKDASQLKEGLDEFC